MYRQPNIVRVIKSRRIRWAGHVAKIEEDRSAFKTDKSTGKRPSGKPRRTWEDNIRMNLKETGIMRNSAQARDYLRALVNATFNFRFLKPWS